MKIRVGHLYPDYLNIYADRGNIAVLARRAAWRGHELEVEAVSIGDALRPGAHDLLYVGGGQDREQALVAVDLAAKGRAAARGGRRRRRGARRLRRLPAARPLLPRPRRRRAARDRALPARTTVAGERRMIGDVLLDCDWAGRTLAGFENHAGRTTLDEGAEPLGRVVSRLRQRRRDPASRAAASDRAIGTYLHGPLLPRNPWLADWLLAQALAHASRRRAAELEPLADELEAEAHDGRGAIARARAAAADRECRPSSTHVRSFFEHLAAVDFGALAIALRFPGRASARADARVAEHHRRRVSGDRGAVARRPAARTSAVSGSTRSRPRAAATS